MADDARLYKLHVKPIYDAIDGRQYKNAIKLCQNKKVAGLDIVQVLKAHCLERIGRPAEALDICRAVQQRKPTDETLLNTMNLVFRLCGHEYEMIPTYEYACSHTEPPSEDLYMLLFVSYARKGDFLKQQQTALKMFKAFGKAKYVCWAALSMLMQVQHSGTPPKMLGLADKMLLKTMRETKSSDGEALQLLIHILQLQDKHEEALQVFDEFAPFMIDAKKNETSSISKGRASEGEGAYEEDIELGPLQAIDRLALEASLTGKVGQWKRSSDVYKVLLDKYNADDWTYLTEFINARIKESHEESVVMVETELLAAIRALAEEPKNKYLRGPWLAQVHVQAEKLKRLKANGSKVGSSDETAFIDSIYAYIDRFYTKTCCFSDLKQYFELFNDDSLVSTPKKDAFIQYLKDTATASTADITSDCGSVHEESTRNEALNRLHRRLFSLKALRFVGAYLTSSVTELESLAKSLVAEYRSNAWLNVGAKGGQREVQNTDDLLLLAAHTLIDIYQRESARREVLVEAASLLEYGLDKSAYNFQMKLLLSRLYGYLGAGIAMLDRHKELDVKHIQLDSLSYLVFDKLLQLCHHTEARRLCDNILRQHKITANETPEFISRAYKLGVYSKVLDMTSFLRERMQNSHTLAIARGESLQFQLQDALTGGSSDLSDLLISPQFGASITELDNMIQQTQRPLSQNQDRSVIVQWTQAPLVRVGHSFSPEGSPLTECDRSATFESSLQWIKLQLVVPKLLLNIQAPKEGASKLLVEEYESIVRSLGLLSSPPMDPKTRIWAWSIDVVKTVVQVNSTEVQPKALQSQLMELRKPLADIRDGVIATLDNGKLLTATGLSTTALLIRDAGLWSGVLVCATIREVSKRSKKDDPLLLALRSVVKAIQETLVAVEAHTKTLRGDSVGDITVDVAALHSLPELAAAQRKVSEKLSQSHKESLALVSQLLKNAASSMRHFQQK